MLLEFAAGVWLGKLSAEARLPARSWGFFLVGGGLICFATMELAGWRNELWRPLLWGAPGAMIVAGALTLEARGPIPLCRAPLSLGDASYSIYLFHPLAVAAIAHAVGASRPALFIPLALGAAIGAGLAARALVERPLMTLCRRLPSAIDALYRRHGFNRLDAGEPRA